MDQHPRHCLDNIRLEKRNDRQSSTHMNAFILKVREWSSGGIVMLGDLGGLGIENPDRVIKALSKASLVASVLKR